MLVLLAMDAGHIPVDGPSSVGVTVARHVKSTTVYVHINRVYQAIVNLAEEASHAGWPEAIPSWGLTVGQRSSFSFSSMY